MSQGAMEIVGPSQGLEALPIELRQQSSYPSALAKLALLVPAILLVLVPAGSLVLFSEPALAQAAAHPGDAVIAGAGVAVFLLLFGTPLARVLRSLGARRTIRLENGAVTVSEQSLFASRAWTLPLTDYRGIVHVVRTSLSGARHELVLLHAEPARRVLLRSADLLSETDVQRACALLRLPAIPAQDLYAWPRREAKATEAAAPAAPLAQAA